MVGTTTVPPQTILYIGSRCSQRCPAAAAASAAVLAGQSAVAGKSTGVVDAAGVRPPRTPTAVVLQVQALVREWGGHVPVPVAACSTK